MLIAGIDVSRGKITLCILDRKPDKALKQFVRECKVIELPRKKQTLKEALVELVSLEFEAAVIEPTGGHYSKLWAEKISKAGRTVLWVGHREVAGYRESWKLPDKTDKTDAIALACYGHERWGMKGMFVGERGLLACELRALYLQIQFLNSATTPLINRLRQQLSWELPELAQKKAERHWLGGAAGMWRAIAGDAKPRWAAIIDESCGMGLSGFSRGLAAQIVASEQAMLATEQQIAALFELPELQPYLKAMQPFFFGHRISTAILANIYPFEKYADRHNGLGAFKLSCGMAQIWVKSGDYEGWTPGGDVECRKALWLWSFGAIPLNPRRSNTSPELEALRHYYYNGSDQKVKTDEGWEDRHFDPGKGNQRLMRCSRRALTMLYRSLKSSL